LDANYLQTPFVGQGCINIGEEEQLHLDCICCLKKMNVQKSILVLLLKCHIEKENTTKVSLLR